MARGELGRKTGRGFYRWQDDRPERGRADLAPPGLAQRLITPLIDRAQALVDTDIVADADLADAGVIFGTGFAPFTGGPLHYRLSRAGDSARPAAFSQPPQ